MEKFREIVFTLVSNKNTAEKIIFQLQEISEDPTKYLDNSDRMLDKSDDYMWLAMVDLLIENNYAFEIDWKDDYGDTEEYINELLSRNNIEFQLNGNITSEEEAETFFPRVNEILAEYGIFRLLNLDIDSDSYVSIISTLDSAKIIVDLDDRISIYTK